MMTEAQVIQKYKEVAVTMIHYAMPGAPIAEICIAVDYSILKRCKNPDAKIINNYKKLETSIGLIELAEYIMSKEPIITASGVMFKKHDVVPNPLTKMMEVFMNSRDDLKKEMFKHPKGSDEFEKYNLLQLLTKIDTNGIYGALGQFSCMFYNIYVASSITAQGRVCISAAGLQFEMFLANNVKYTSIDEIITFIYNVIGEADKRKYDDRIILDRDATVAETFYHIMTTCGFIPTNDECNKVADILSHLNQSDINRLYYKNNLYEFMENKYLDNLIKNIMINLKVPYINPYKPPAEIKDDMNELSSLFMEYVYYSYQIIDKFDKFKNMIKSVIIIQDTDSCIISLDAWYRYVLKKVENVDIPTRYIQTDPIAIMDNDELEANMDDDGVLYTNPIEYLEPEYDYNFFDDTIIEKERECNPIKIIPQDGVRYSIINVMAYCLTNIINDYMISTTKGYHSFSDNKKCLLIMKNEFLFARALLANNAKKNYATLQELQEGNIVPVNKRLDIKGMSIDKSGLNAKSRKRLKEILYEDILKTDTIDQIKIIKDLSLMEKSIYESLNSGSKDYYKPVNIKSLSSYDDPMRIQGIKGSVVWNLVRGKAEAIDLEKRNSVMVAKVNINPNNIESIKQEHEDIYNSLMEFMRSEGERKQKKPGKVVYEPIEAISIPNDAPLPDWLLQFIDYTTIINDNLTNFPLEDVGIHKGSNSVNYTNILKI